MTTSMTLALSMAVNFVLQKKVHLLAGVSIFQHHYRKHHTKCGLRLVILILQTFAVPHPVMIESGSIGIINFKDGIDNRMFVLCQTIGCKLGDCEVER